MTKEITIETDLGKEPGFVGGLAIVVNLRSDKEVVGVVEVHCQVIARDGR